MKTFNAITLLIAVTTAVVSCTRQTARIHEIQQGDLSYKLVDSKFIVADGHSVISLNFERHSGPFWVTDRRESVVLLVRVPTSALPDEKITPTGWLFRYGMRFRYAGEISGGWMQVAMREAVLN